MFIFLAFFRDTMLLDIIYRLEEFAIELMRIIPNLGLDFIF